MNPEVYSELENGTAAASVITSSAWPALLAPVADPALDPDIGHRLTWEPCLAGRRLDAS